MIVVEGLSKRFQTRTERVQAVNDISFEVASGEMVTLLGPSGCGKTTTLRCVAGLERPEGGRITINGRTVVDTGNEVFVPAHLRRLGMVFQSYAIWPHMTVHQNVAYALEGQRMSRAERRQRAMEALELVKLAEFAERPAPRLSGGQQQRVAIARALAGHPDALLFDEPLSNLDAKLRAETRTEIRKLQKQTGLTSIYVTHDQSEALAISDWVIVMQDGRIMEKGRPSEIYRYPRHIFTAQFIGDTNLIPGQVESVDSSTKLVSVDTPVGRLLGTASEASVEPGDAVQISIRPEDLTTAPPPEGKPWNQIKARVDIFAFAGSAVEAELTCGDYRIQCLFGRDAELAPDTEIVLGFAPEACVILPDQGSGETASQAKTAPSGGTGDS
jgi:ABC-type Fe3+/spermidine/putrescine transport system ATPase subunit